MDVKVAQPTSVLLDLSPLCQIEFKIVFLKNGTDKAPEPVIVLNKY